MNRSSRLHPEYIVWSVQDLRLATLQLLYAEQKKSADAGLSAAGIAKSLQLTEISDMHTTLLWLLDEKFIASGQVKFRITDASIQYLREQLAKPTDADTRGSESDN